jgi:hypothetical protein
MTEYKIGDKVRFKYEGLDSIGTIFKIRRYGDYLIKLLPEHEKDGGWPEKDGRIEDNLLPGKYWNIPERAIKSSIPKTLMDLKW